MIFYKNVDDQPFDIIQIDLVMKLCSGPGI